MSKRRSPKVGKSESPEDSFEPKIESPKSDEYNADPPTGEPRSEINKSEIKNPTSEIPNKSEIENPNSEIKMEVHHHPEVEKKGLKEYLLEGLMIFLAVTMGFFAESYREYTADKNKEHKIIRALAADIRKDTANLHNTINFYMPEHNAWVDSADIYVSSLDVKTNERKILKAVWNATVWDLYSPPEITLNILKNSGTFDLIENDNVKAEILKYNGAIDEYLTYRGFLFSAEHSSDTAQTAIINRKLMRVLLADSYVDVKKHKNGFISDKDIPQGPLLKTYNRTAIMKTLKRVNQVDESLNDVLGLYEIILKEEDTLLNTLKVVYHLDE